MFLGIPYELIGPDGTRVVFGNSDAAKADPDYIGPLRPDSGIQGLLDTADVRESTSDLVERDGSSSGSSWLSRRSGTITGLLRPEVYDLAVVAAAESQLKRATRALRADCLLRWTPPNDSAPRQLRCRRQGRVSVTERRPKAWQVTLTSNDVYALSSAEQQVTIPAAAGAGEVGYTDNYTDPYNSPSAVSGQQSVLNVGDAPTWPRFRILGPIVNPTVLNNTTGQQVVLSYTLNAGEWLDVYPERGVILAQGTADRYGALNFLASSWWQLQPGANDVRLLASSYTNPAALTVWWRHAWE